MNFKYIIPLLAAILLDACTEQLPGTRDSGEEILIPLHVSATGMSSAGADGAGPTAINSLDILVFPGEGDLQSSKLLHALKARKDEAGKGKFLVPFPNWDEKSPYRLVILANMDHAKINTDCLRPGEDIFSTISENLHGEPRQRYSPTDPLPMFGVVNGGLPLEIKKGMSLGNIKLIRDVARIDIGVGKYNSTTGEWDLLEKDSPYLELTDVQAWAPMGRDYYLPKWENFSFETDGAPLINKAAGSLEDPVISPIKWLYTGTDISANGASTYCKDIIYLPEAPLRGYTALQPENKTKRTTLILGGYFHDPEHTGGKTEKTWYRVDFTPESENTPDGELHDLLRNHLYRISLSVKTPGAKTPEEAWEAPPQSIRVEILPWAEGGNIEFKPLKEPDFPHRLVSIKSLNYDDNSIKSLIYCTDMMTSKWNNDTTLLPKDYDTSKDSLLLAKGQAYPLKFELGYFSSLGMEVKPGPYNSNIKFTYKGHREIYHSGTPRAVAIYTVEIYREPSSPHSFSVGYSPVFLDKTDQWTLTISLAEFWYKEKYPDLFKPEPSSSASKIGEENR